MQNCSYHFDFNPAWHSSRQQFGVNGIQLKNYYHMCTLRKQSSSDPKPEISLIIFSKVVSPAQTQEGINKIVCHAIL